MPNDTSFAILYRRLIDRNFDPPPARLARNRGELIARLSALSPPPGAKELWTITEKYDNIKTAKENGEEKK
jgi:hypothetical protein